LLMGGSLPELQDDFTCPLAAHKAQLPPGVNPVVVKRIPGKAQYLITPIATVSETIYDHTYAAYLCDMVPCEDLVYPGDANYSYSITTGRSWTVGGSLGVEAKTGLAIKMLTELQVSASVNGSTTGSTYTTVTTGATVVLHQCQDKRVRVFSEQDFVSGAITTTPDKVLWRYIENFGHGQIGWVYQTTTCNVGSANGNADAGKRYRTPAPILIDCCTPLPDCCGCWVEE